MRHLYLVRHAATQPNDHEAAVWPLSAHGEQQAQLLAAHPCWRAVQRIISSSEEKALATVRPTAAQHNLPLDSDDGLCELRRPAVWTSQEVYEQTVAAVFAHPDRSLAGKRLRVCANGCRRRSLVCCTCIRMKHSLSPLTGWR